MEDQHTAESRLLSDQDAEALASKVLRQMGKMETIPTRKQREKWYRDNFWQFVGALVGFAAMIITIIVFYASQETKSIGIVELSKTSLTSVADAVAEDVQLVYRGNPIPGLFLVQIKLENDGDVEIRSTDYEEPIALVFSPGATVVDATVVQSEPSGIELGLTRENNQVILSRTLLNQGDRVVIQTLVVYPSDQQLVLQAKGRIAGIRNIPIQDALQQEPVVQRGELHSILSGVLNTPVPIILLISMTVLVAIVLALLFFRRDMEP